MAGFVCSFRQELNRKMGALGLQGASSSLKRDADENACLRTMSATRYLNNKDAVDLPRGLGGGSAVAIVAKGGSDRDCLSRDPQCWYK